MPSAPQLPLAAYNLMPGLTMPCSRGGRVVDWNLAWRWARIRRPKEICDDPRVRPVFLVLGE